MVAGVMAQIFVTSSAARAARWSGAHVEQRRRPQAGTSTAKASTPRTRYSRPFRSWKRRDVLIADRPEHDALDQPQRVGRAENQCRRGEEAYQKLARSSPDHQELADEARGARQPRVCHGEQHLNAPKTGIVLTTPRSRRSAAVHAVVETPMQKNMLGDEAWRSSVPSRRRAHRGALQLPVLA